MSAPSPSRQPKGVPVGGQFAATARAETGLSLVPERAPLRETSRGVFEVVNATTEDGGSDGPVRTVAFHMGGIAHTRAESGATALRMQHSEQQDVLHAKLEQLAATGAKATVLFRTKSGDVMAKEGSLQARSDGSIVMLDKGARTGKGIYLRRAGGSNQVLGVVPGYGGSAALADRYRDHAEHVPQLEKATFDDLPVADETAEPPSAIAAVYVFDHPGFDPSHDGRGSMFFVTDFMPGDGSHTEAGQGIVNGYGVYAPGSGLESESGSMYASQLARWGGRVKGYQAGSHTFRDAMDMGNASTGYHDDCEIEPAWASVRAASR